MKWKIPLVDQYVGGVRSPRPQVLIQVVTRYGAHPIRFIVDTAADLTSIPAPLARSVGIPFDEWESARGTAVGLVGRTTRYRGAIRLVIGAERFAWPCDFVVPPTAAPQRVQDDRYGVLGRAGFLAAFALCIDDKFLRLRRSFPERAAWYRLFRLLWPPFPMHWPPNRPL